jgi:hypothetical protein
MATGGLSKEFKALGFDLNSLVFEECDTVAT